jgi:exodeoxyribonuclease V gamma subunit
MPIHLIASNSLEPLLDRLSDVVSRKGRDPFIPEWVVTQTEGMDVWIRQRLAARFGIACNIRFSSPEDVVSSLYLQLATDARDPFDKEILRWGVYDILGSEPFKERFMDIAAYYGDSDIKRISLADELADLFDQYQVYRSEKIREWNENADRGGEAADWQPWVWQRLRTRFTESHSDRVEISQRIIDALKVQEKTAWVAARMPSLHVFGLAIVSPYFLHVLKALSRCMDIHVYLVNPSPERYWLDDRSEKQITRLLKGEDSVKDRAELAAKGNELLLNWGRVIRETLYLLLSDEEMVNAYNVELLEPDGSAPLTLLQKIQADIRENRNGEERVAIGPDDWADRSITLSGCFTPLREVEALYNHLVGLLDTRGERMSPREILVMVSDIDLYAPLIRAVFEHAPYRFPFIVADQTVTSDNNMFTAIRSLLSIEGGRMKAEEVMELLESPYMRQRFGISDTDAIRKAVRQAGIVFSMDGREADETRLVSWNYGLKKILYGFCMSGSETFHDGRDELVPLDTDEGASALERIRFIHFVRMLEYKIRARARRRTIAGWADYLRELVDDMVFQAGERDDEDYPVFIRLLDRMTKLHDRLSVEVDFEVFRHSFLHRLRLERKPQNFLGSGITFCSMVPMRSIPFKVIAMLGMDNDKYPRKETPLSFDIMTDEPKPGDRNIRNNDRHLFLETLLSAKESLYISYIAKDAGNADDIPPSSLVDELIDYVAQGMGEDTDRLRKKWVDIHPLHGFGSLYFGGGRLRNYLPEGRFRTGVDVRTTQPAPPSDPGDRLDLAQLVHFLQNPPRFTLNRRFNTYYEDRELLLPEHEMFEPVGLEKWALRSDLLEIEGDGLEEYLKRKVLKGGVPLANMGKAHVQRIHEELKVMRMDMAKARDGREPRTFDVDIPLRDTRLVGRMGNLYGDNLVETCHSSDHFKHLLGAWVRFLALRASGLEADLAFIIKKSPGVHNIPANSVSQAEALGMLTGFSGYHRQALSGYFHFFPGLADRNFRILEGDYENFLAEFEDAVDNPRNYTFNDVYLLKAVEHGFFSEDSYESLRENTLVIMKPLAERLPVLFPAS